MEGRSKLRIAVQLLGLLLLAFLCRSSHGGDGLISQIPPHRALLGGAGRDAQISNCSDMATGSQCSQKPNCRWCRSDVLDDTCFAKSEAWRLPHQVFVCR